MDECPTSLPRFHKSDVPKSSPYKINDMAKIASALSDPIRIRIIYLLTLRENICTCEFQELLDLNQSRVSYHLKILLDIGLIERQIISNWRHYSLLRKDILEKFEGLLQ